MVNEEASANFRGWMNLDAGKESTNLRQQPRNKWNVELVKKMCEAMHDNGMEAGIGQENLKAASEAPRCRVALKHSPKVIYDFHSTSPSFFVTASSTLHPSGVKQLRETFACTFLIVTNDNGSGNSI
jgi:hypothetical protein